jgi:penicillin amidase
MSRPVKITLWTVSCIILIIALVLATLWWLLAGSQAQLKGSVAVSGISDVTVINRDKQGLVTIIGHSRNDISFALGYTHAQERLFQMDLLRRNSAGELSELFGSVAASVDKRVRKHQFRKRAEVAVANLSDTEQALLNHYADGVNAGMAALRSAPFEYLLLQAPLEDWTAADSLLVACSMYMDLQDEWGEMERSLSAMHDLLPKDWFTFLTPNGGDWDAPIEGDNFTFRSALPAKPLRDFATTENAAAYHYADEIIAGSNNWSVSGALTGHGGALVAGDMHLGLDVPNIWFRASWFLPDDNRRVTGVTLPGTPLMVIGSNEHIAWGFTNSYGDYLDLIRLQINARGDEYLTPDGWKKIIEEQEIIQIKGEPAQTTTVRKTQWGPIIGEDHFGNLLAMRWVAHDVSGLNLKLAQLETADNTEQAIAIAAHAGIPGQNLNVGDSTGHIGWTVMGVLPKRTGFNSNLEQRLVTDWSDGTRHWQGLLPAEHYPAVVKPVTNRIWTANARIVSDDKYANMGDGLGAIGARQQQIRDRLFEKDSFNEADFLAIHLDDEARFLSRWQQLLSAQLSDELIAVQPQLAEFRQHINNWQGRASATSVGYLLVKRYREKVIDQSVGHLFRYVAAQTENFWSGKVDKKVEYPVWRLISEQPAQHTPAGFSDWNDFLVSMITELNDELADPTIGLTEQTWGNHNMVTIQHPMSSVVPFIGLLLDMPKQGLSGDTFMPRVQGIDFGASQRMAVAPGHEAEGYFHMATGQSGHPLSPFYGKGHEDWVNGVPSPFLPGDIKYTLVLTVSGE